MTKTQQTQTRGWQGLRQSLTLRSAEVTRGLAQGFPPRCAGLTPRVGWVGFRHPLRTRPGVLWPGAGSHAPRTAPPRAWGHAHVPRNRGLTAGLWSYSPLTPCGSFHGRQFLGVSWLRDCRRGWGWAGPLLVRVRIGRVGEAAGRGRRAPHSLGCARSQSRKPVQL